MRPRVLLPLCVALACGIASMVIVQRQFGSPETSKPGMKVVLAAVSIPQHTHIDAGMLKVVEIPQESVFLPEGVVVDPAKIIGRVAKLPIEKNEILSESKFRGVYQGGMLAALEPGMRAVSIGISADRAFGGFIGFGSMVDVILTTNARAQDPATTFTLLQQVKVLAVNHDLLSADRDESRGKSVNMVTFALTPQQVLILNNAQNLGTISLSMRSPDDMTQPEQHPVRNAVIAEPAVAKPPATVADASTADSDLDAERAMCKLVIMRDARGERVWKFELSPEDEIVKSLKGIAIDSLSTRPNATARIPKEDSPRHDNG